MHQTPKQTSPTRKQSTPSFDHPPWRRCTPPPERFSITHNPCRGEDRKRLLYSIKNLQQSQSDTMLIYCRGTGPNPNHTAPQWTGAAIAYRRGVEIGSQATVIGQHASHRDAAFQALVDATTLARDMLTTSPAPSVVIYTADHFVIPWCQTTDRHENAKACRAVCNTIAEVLFTHAEVVLSIKWIPGHSNFHPLTRLAEVATSAAREAAPNPQPTPTTVAAL
jgi:ribonuclease HI